MAASLSQSAKVGICNRDTWSANYLYSGFELTHNIEVLPAIAESAETGQTFIIL